MPSCCSCEPLPAAAAFCSSDESSAFAFTLMFMFMFMFMLEAAMAAAESDASGDALRRAGGSGETGAAGRPAKHGEGELPLPPNSDCRLRPMSCCGEMSGGSSSGSGSAAPGIDSSGA